MLNKIEHIGIAVKNLEAANAMFEKLTLHNLLKVETVESEDVKVSFFQIGEVKIEFLQALNSNSAIARFIEKHGQGIHHIAFATDNIESDMVRLKAEGFEFINPFPTEGADAKRICFLHPRSTPGLLVELCSDLVI